MLPQPRRCTKHLSESPRCLARSCGKSREYLLNVPQHKGCGTTRAAQRQLNERGRSCAKKRAPLCLPHPACRPLRPPRSPQQHGQRGAGGCGQLAALTGPAPAVERPLAAGRLPGLLRDPPALRPAAAGRPLRPGAPRPRRLSAHLAAISRARRPRRGGSAELQGRAVTLGGEGAAAPGGWGRARLSLRRGAGLPPPGRPLSRWQPAAVPRCALTGWGSTKSCPSPEPQPADSLTGLAACA